MSAIRVSVSLSSTGPRQAKGAVSDRPFVKAGPRSRTEYEHKVQPTDDQVNYDYGQ